MPKTGPNFRSLPVGNYVIFYRSTHDGIELGRVLRGVRDMTALLRAEP